MNTKRLYQADGYAVKELLKITALLYDALKYNNNEKQDEFDDEEHSNLREFDISDKVRNNKYHKKNNSRYVTWRAKI